MQILLGQQHLRRVSVLFPVFISTYHFISISCFSICPQICMESCAMYYLDVIPTLLLLFHVCLRRKRKLQSPWCQFIKSKSTFTHHLLLQSTRALQLVQLTMKQVMISMCMHKTRARFPHYAAVCPHHATVTYWCERTDIIVSTKLLVCLYVALQYINGCTGKAPGLVTAKTLSGYLASWGDSGYDRFTFLFETNCIRQPESYT